ncbi:MAG TPA: lipase maturation factor family protein, partial [Polyangiales bacterium]|nr:lipase maturation factor family protein [Polyangiales bacterium]
MELDGFGVARLVLQRGLAAIYLLAFASALNQFRALLGERGLLPVPAFLARHRFREAPSIFQLGYSDRRFAIVAWLGIALSLLALCGVSERGPIGLSLLVWLVLWVLYLSIVNVGQAFYGFGWESMLCEAGFFACFLGPAHVAPSPIPILLLRWMLFRVELGAGLIKIRHDSCWRDCTCLYYHYETQPLPNPLSRLFHRLPKPLHRVSVMFSHFVQLAVPFGLFLPQPYAIVAGGLLVFHQLLLIVSGNYAWLNWLTVVLGASTLVGDQRAYVARPFAFDVVLYVLLAVSVALSYQPTLNFFSRRQRMNFSYNPLHLLNAYGAFGSVTRERYEVIVEGAAEGAGWRAYELRAKPGDPKRRPRQFAPYHLRLDWMMWFLPFTANVAQDQLYVLRHDRWFLRFVRKLLEGDAQTLALLRANPFPEQPP